MKALVLGGGSLKGAWQVGAIQAVLEKGFKPDMIYGISAGALNSTFMVHKSYELYKKAGVIDWNQVNMELIGFWIKNITKPNDIGILKSRFMLGFDTILSRFDGILDTSPLHNSLDKTVDIENLQKSNIKLKVGAVNINTGNIYYASPKDDHFLDYVKASSSIPVLMPAVAIGGNYRNVYLDGGLREVVPIKKAIEDGATEIYAIATHTRTRNMEPINYRSFISLIDRIKDISVNQFENNDIDWAENYNDDIISFGEFSVKKKIRLKVIRPKENIEIDLTNFNTEEIKKIIKDGYTQALQDLK